MSLSKSKIIEKAQKFASKGQFKQAIGEWKKLIATLPDDGNIYNAIGDLHLKDGQQEQATDFFIKAAEAFQSEGFELKSIAVFKKALKVDPTRIEISEKLAGVYADRGLIGNAIGDYLQAAKAYLNQGNFEASLSVYRKISDLDPENVDILLEVAEMCQKEGHNENAIEEYKKLRSFFEENNRPSEAEAILQKIIALDPSYAAQNKNQPAVPEAPVEAFSPESLPTESLKEEIPGSTNDDIHSDFPEAENFQEPEPFDEAQSEQTSSEFFEPESELMTDEQTIYAVEGSFHLDDVQAECDDKTLEARLTEAEVYIQHELFDKAIEQLQGAAVQFPREPAPLLKLKELYEQQGDTRQQIETLQSLSALYQSAGDAEKSQAMLAALRAMQDSAQFASSPEIPSDDAVEEEMLAKDPFPKGLFGDEQSFEDSLNTSGEDTDNNEMTQTPAPDLDYLPSDDIAEVDLPELEQDPLRSSTEPGNLPKPRSDDPFFDLDDSESEEPNETYFADEAYAIDFDEPTLGAPVSSDIETAEINLEALEIPKPPSGGEDLEKAAEEVNEDYIDLQAYFSDELEPEEAEEEDQTSLERAIRSVQDKHQEDLQPEALETEYDLGIAYREMGMLSEAIKAFENASQGASRFKDALTMLTICHRERGSIDQAITALEQGLNRNTSDQSVTIALKYELALLQETQGATEKAAFLYDAIFEIDPNYREVAQKREQAHEESLAAPPPASDEYFVDTEDKPQKKKDRVSYL